MKLAVIALLFALPLSALGNTEKTQDEVMEEVVVTAKRIPATIEDKKELISLIEAPIEPTNTTKSNLFHFSLRICLGLTISIVPFVFLSFLDELPT